MNWWSTSGPGSMPYFPSLHAILGLVYGTNLPALHVELGRVKEEFS